jgi:1-deoxy-D-xylulose-5-phosphate reductoisomerase
LKTLKKGIAILGSTGSIGTQALDVIRKNPDRFEVKVLTAQKNCDLLIAQALEFEPERVVIADEARYEKVKSALLGKSIKVLSGAQGLEEVVQLDGVNVVLTALVGFAGLLPTIKAIEAGKTIALANKETLVVAGEIITSLAQKHKVAILPVDSEHSAIFQCLAGEHQNPIEKIILTASGGPFRGKDKEFLRGVSKHQALRHPNWQMGAKITIDSATLMNKGLEVIEAKWLFNLSADQIEVIVHPQSIIHSLVQFEDGSMKAQLGLPDMRLPIQYALGYPDRFMSDFERFDFINYPNLSFEKPDTHTFRNLELAFMAVKKGGNLPCILNAANEIAVAAFLSEAIGFLEISELVEGCMEKMPFIEHPSLEDYKQTDRDTRIMANEKIKGWKH